jgi:PAS domain S-box-containing protein
VPPTKSSFLDKVLGRINRLDSEGLQTVVQRLARERNFLETLFNRIEDGVVVTDEDGRVIYVNEAVTGLLGFTSEQAEGQPVTRLLPRMDWEQLKRVDQDGGTGVVRQEFEVTYPTPRFLRLYAAPLDGEAAGSSGVALILHDATEARNKTAETIESERLHALTLLAASVAHEIGNPLNALHIHLQLMEREVRKLQRAARNDDSTAAATHADKLEGFLNVAKGEISRLDYIVTEFLQAMRPTPPRLQPTALNTVIRETLEVLRPELENRKLRVAEKLGRSLPVPLLDAGQFKQVLVNLIKNAMQAMVKGGTLTLESGSNSKAVWVSVADTGVGIPPEQLKHIFEPYYTTKQKGTGLGLMIVQRIMRDHGGRIELESRVGQGTVFKLWVPTPGQLPALLPMPGTGEADSLPVG